MYKVIKSASFCYAHRLPGHKGRCRNLHGHNAEAEVTLAAPKLDAMNMVADFGDLSRALKGWLDGNFDHKTILCETDPLLPVLREQGVECFAIKEIPTAEKMAELICAALLGQGFPVTEVKVWETPTSCAVYTREN
jgi:6-pyruvoyltetrahydropterin/6-carboxytetrahydropterin synthase